MIITAVISIEYYRGDIMDEQFIRDRLSFLRTQKGISEYKMSLDLGHSKHFKRQGAAFFVRIPLYLRLSWRNAYGIL